MIVGIGLDLTEIGRVAKLLEQPAGRRFMERVLTPEEREIAARRKGRLAEYTASRFAAKEAVSKALGCGIGRQVGFQDIAVASDATGKPVCVLSAAARERLGLSPDIRIHLSITHTETTAGAYAVVEDCRIDPAAERSHEEAGTSRPGSPRD